MALVIPIICSAVGYLIAKDKDRGTAGAVWGFLLGPLGIVVAACLKERE